MRESRHHPGGEPCLSPLKSGGDPSGPSAKSLLSDARAGNLSGMKKRMRNSIFRKAEDVNQRDERNCTPMHYAAKNSDKEMVKFLLSKGGDLAAQDKHGWSVLQYAVRYASLDAVEHLLDVGADLFHKEKKGWACLHLAARNGQPDKARLLLERGARVNETQDQGWNALHLAVRYGQPDTISTLLEHGIDINAANLGWTALHLAALNGHTDIASILLNKSARTDSVNQEGRTALDIARAEGHDTIVAIILEREFQGGPGGADEELVLPTPPATPPSAPPLPTDEQDGDDGGEVDTAHEEESFTQWRGRIQRQLQRIEGEESLVSPSDEDDNFPGSEDVGRRDGTMEIRITWKTLEEETSELMAQLERLRLREVNKIKDSILKAKKEHRKKLKLADRQREMLEAQVEAVEANMPRFDQVFDESKQEAERNKRKMEEVLTALRLEGDKLEELSRSQVENSYSEANVAKKRLLADLLTAQRREVEETEAARERVSETVQGAEQRLQLQVSVSEEKKRLLLSDLADVAAQKAQLVRDHEEHLSQLGASLERAERRSMSSALGSQGGPDRDENWFGCPVCFLVLKPPTRIFQCPEGHILCEECKENPALVHCPQCRCPLEGQCSRNRALEEVARGYFPMAPSETL